jgi:hypothetical protein
MKNLHIHILHVLFQVVVCCVVCSCKPPAATTKEVSHNQRDSVHEKITERLVPYAVPGETVTVTEYIECDSVTNKPKPAKGSARNGKSETSFDLDKNGKLTSKCKCDSVELLLKETQKEVYTLKQTSDKEKDSEVRIEYKTRDIDRVCRMMAVILIVVIFFKIKTFIR